MLIVLLTFISNLQSIDSEILFWIHRNLHSSIGNAIIHYLRIPIFWLPLYILILGIFIKKWKLKFWIPLLIIGFTVGLCDYTSVHLFKKQIERPRPCYMYENDPRLDLLIPCGGKYGFISTHAANHMAIAVFLFSLLGRKAPRLKWLWILWALSIGFAQVYVGVHYPLDVLCGFLYGGLIGYISIRLFIKFFPSFFTNERAFY